MPAVVGVFNDREETASAIDALVADGIDQASIGVIWREQEVTKPVEETVVTYVDHFDSPGEEARKGALGGAVGGGTAGVGSVLLASAGVLLAPPIGALFAAGTLASAAAAATAGAVGGSIAGGLIGALLGAADHDATKVVTKETTFVEMVERHGFVVTIEVEAGDERRASEALSQAGAGDVSILDSRGRHRP